MPIDFDFFTETAPGTGTPGTPDETGTDTTTAGTPETPGGRTETPGEKITSKKASGSPVIVNIPEPNVPEKKPRKPRTPKVKTDLKDLETNLSAITKGVYSMTAKILKSDIFEISDDEARQIAEPLAKIVDKMQFTETANKYGDGVALVMAVSIITAPRIMLYGATKPKKNKPVKLEDKTHDKTTAAKTSHAENNGGNTPGNPPANNPLYNDPLNVIIGGY